MQALAQALTCAGFSDLVIEDQAEFEQFLEENRAKVRLPSSTDREHAGGKLATTRRHSIRER